MNMKKIDMHCHTTDRKIASTSASVEAITGKMEENDIEKTVLLATYFAHRGSGISNFRLMDWIRNESKFYMFGSLDFEHYFYQGINELRELAETFPSLKGIKIYTSYQEIDLKSEKMKKLISLAYRFSFPLAFHCGYSYQAMKHYNKMAITEMVKASELQGILDSGVNVIASHMAKPFTEDLIFALNKNENLYTDVSGLIDSKTDSADKPRIVGEVKKLVNKCGTSQLLFGTDFPVQSYEDSIYFVEQGLQGFSEAEKQDVYYNNAMRLLKLR